MCSNIIAPEGQVWVCGACGKRSIDKYGDYPINHGWDASCMLHAFLAYKDKLVLKDNGRVETVLESGVVKEEEKAVDENI